MVWLVIVVAIVAAVAAVLWFVLTRQHPSRPRTTTTPMSNARRGIE